jgi:predicted DNA-binding transcriptional regulator AlpA
MGMNPSDQDAQPGGPDYRLLPWSQVRIIAGLSRTTIWRLQKTGDFPASVQVSRNRVGWWQSELLAWKRARTPRRLPEPKIIAAPEPIARSLILPSGSAEPQTDHIEGASGGAVKPEPTAKRRRRPAVSPGQGAFDF